MSNIIRLLRAYQIPGVYYVSTYIRCPYKEVEKKGQAQRIVMFWR